MSEEQDIVPMSELSEKFLKNRDEIVAICDKSVSICKEIRQDSKAVTLESFKNQMADEHFRVMVLGSFKRGKSTFINALLGEDVLPNFATPCTAVINEVKWSDEKEVHIHFKSPIPEHLPDELTPEAAEHIEKHKGEEPVPPIVIPPDQLEYYVVIPDPSKDQAESITESPFHHAEVFWPLELCKNGIEIIDSPGLDEHESRTRVTEDYLKKADVVLFVQSCSALAGKAEMDFVQNNLLANGYEDIIFICNRFDEVREKERPRVMDYARKKLGAVTGMGPEKGIFFISAYKALDGRLDEKKNPEKALALIEESGILTLEKFLYTYLFENRGKIKIIHPARKMLHEIVTLRNDVRDSKRLQSEKLETLQKKAADARARAETETKRIDQLLRKFERKRNHLKDKIREKAGEFYNYNYPNMLTAEMKEYQPETKFSLLDSFGMKAKIELLTKELEGVLQQKAGVIQTKWVNENITPTVRREMEESLEDIAEEVDAILQSIEEIRADVSGVSVDHDEIGKGEELSGLNRLLSGAGGMILLGPVGAMMGATFGCKEMLKNAGITMGIAIGATLVLGPLGVPAIIGIALASGTVQALFKTKQVEADTKDKVVSAFIAVLKDKSQKLSEQVADEVYKSSEDVATLLDQGLHAQIQSVLELADNAVREKEKGEVESKKYQEKLDEADNVLGNLNEKLNDIIIESAL